MLNANKERELCYVTRINDIKPIEGRDRVECAVVGGWTVMVRKDQFKPGDLGIYFEIDSKVPATKPFEFLAQKHYKIKTQKFSLKDADGNKVGDFYSQGLLMPAEDFGWEFINTGQFAGDADIIDTKIEGDDRFLKEGDFLTKRLGVTYAVESDNKRKSSGPDKYKKMAARRPELFKKPFIQKMYKTELGKRILFLLFGRKKDKKGFPTWVKKTDEERCQNLPQLFPGDGREWIATEKIDGTSTTFTIRGFGRKQEYCVCSRNVLMDKPDKNCYYDTNVYLGIDKKYKMQDVLSDLLLKNKCNNVEYVTVQGETYGAGIQKRDYSISNYDFMAFNLIFGFKDGTSRRYNPIEMTKVLKQYNIPCVPIVDTQFKIPSTCDELLKIAEGKSKIDGKEREGLVFRTYDGVESFKAVSNPFLLHWHNG